MITIRIFFLLDFTIRYPIVLRAKIDTLGIEQHPAVLLFIRSSELRFRAVSDDQCGHIRNQVYNYLHLYSLMSLADRLPKSGSVLLVKVSLPEPRVSSLSNLFCFRVRHTISRFFKRPFEIQILAPYNPGQCRRSSRAEPSAVLNIHISWRRKWHVWCHCLRTA